MIYIEALQTFLLALLVYERIANRSFKRRQAKPPTIKAVPLHPDALRTKEK